MSQGIEVWYVTCRACGREVLFRDVGNDLVGKQEQLVCEGCGARGADLRRVWHRDQLPAGVRVWAGRRG
jgi:DNA-directed RNA polymerase subunit RPC12/RpoP